MNIEIVSTDQRYGELNRILINNGHSSKIVTQSEVGFPDALILSVRDEFDNEALAEVFARVKKDTKVFCGNKKRVEKYFDGYICDYSKNEYFLTENAKLTAEATIGIFHQYTRRSIDGRKIFISGYGRIGKELARIFSFLGGEIYVYARREEVKRQIESDGYFSVPLDYSCKCDVILNTAPAVIYENSLIERIKGETVIIELASVCGFENKERVNFALGLPGKAMPLTSGRVIYDTIRSFF